MILILGFFSFKAFPIPEIVPPVPTPATPDGAAEADKCAVDVAGAPGDTGGKPVPAPTGITGVNTEADKGAADAGGADVDGGPAGRPQACGGRRCGAAGSGLLDDAAHGVL